jgi:hypothetical protein
MAVTVAIGYGRMLPEHTAEAKLRHVVLHTVVDEIDHSQSDSVSDAPHLLPMQQPPTAHGNSSSPNDHPQAPPPPDRSLGRRISYRCRFCLVTALLAVGVLKRPELLTFTPALPDGKLSAISRMGFGLLNKVVLEFDRRWWQEEDLNILSVLTPLKSESEASDAQSHPTTSTPVHPLWIATATSTLRIGPRRNDAGI